MFALFLWGFLRFFGKGLGKVWERFGFDRLFSVYYFSLYFLLYFCSCFQMVGYSATPTKIEQGCKKCLGWKLHPPPDSPQPIKKINMGNNTKPLVEQTTANIYTTKEVLTSDEVAQYLGITKSCLYKWTMERRIPHYKSPTGKLCFFNRKEIEQWMQSVRVATEDEIRQQAQAQMKKGGKR